MSTQQNPAFAPPSASNPSEDLPIIFPDVVPASPPSRPAPPPVEDAEEVDSEPGRRRHHRPGAGSGRDNSVLALQRARVAERSRQRALDLARLVAIEGKSWKEAAVVLGVTPAYCRNILWKQVRSMTLLDFASPEERERVTSFIVDSLSDVLRTARSLVKEHAAYGAVAVQAAGKLADLYGIDLGDRADAASVASLAEVGAEVKRVAPLLGNRLEAAARIRALASAGIRPSEAAEAG